MSRQIINETCALQIPDHFEILSGKDLDGMRQGTGDPFRWGVRDRENHMIIIALWKQYPALLSCMLDLKTVVKKNEQMSRKARVQVPGILFYAGRRGESRRLSLHL